MAHDFSGFTTKQKQDSKKGWYRTSGIQEAKGGEEAGREIILQKHAPNDTSLLTRAHLMIAHSAIDSSMSQSTDNYSATVIQSPSQSSPLTT